MGALREWLHPCQEPSHIRHQLDVAIDSHKRLSDKLVNELQRNKSVVARNMQMANEALRITDEVRRGEEL
jgi:hypothetical protein